MMLVPLCQNSTQHTWGCHALSSNLYSERENRLEYGTSTRQAAARRDDEMYGCDASNRKQFCEQRWVGVPFAGALSPHVSMCCFSWVALRAYDALYGSPRISDCSHDSVSLRVDLGVLPGYPGTPTSLKLRQWTRAVLTRGALRSNSAVLPSPNRSPAMLGLPSRQQICGFVML